MTIHAHCYWNGRDCDGEMSTDFVYQEGTPEGGIRKTWAWRDDLDLLDSLVAYAAYLPDVGPSSIEIRLRASEDDDLGPLYVITSSRETEEGYDSMHIEMCADTTCDLELRGHRDRSAERMGY